MLWYSNPQHHMNAIPKLSQINKTESLKIISKKHHEKVLGYAIRKLLRDSQVRSRDFNL